MGYWSITAEASGLMDAIHDVMTGTGRKVIGYTGDAPADYMGPAIEKLVGKTFDELYYMPEDERVKLYWLAMNTPELKSGLDDVYKPEFGREANSHELSATIKFVLGVSDVGEGEG